MSKNFITNNPQKTKTLETRIRQLISVSSELKFLVGYFYFSGWSSLVESIKQRLEAYPELKIKILVGMDMGKFAGQLLEVPLHDHRKSMEELINDYFHSLNISINSDEFDTQEFYEQVEFFLRLIEEDKLIIRKTGEPNHAKLYLFNLEGEAAKVIASEFITGSSNLTRAGFKGQNEFNVEIRDFGIEEAHQYFDELWENSIPITEKPENKKRILEFFRNHSQVAVVSPFEAYLFVLKTYMDLQEMKKLSPTILQYMEKKGYRQYAYQNDAVKQALSIIEHYNGVIIADVVGLGKSVIASMIAAHLQKRGIIICPPGLMGDKNATSGWEKYKEDFGLTAWKVFSTGDLENALNYVNEYGDDIEVVIVDEAHRFRNQETMSYAYLSSICQNRIVILLTATPFNNTPADIFSMLKLFIIPGKSKITLDDNLERRFSYYNKVFSDLSYIAKNHNSADRKKFARAQQLYEAYFGDENISLTKVHQRSEYLARQIRQVLEPVLIRRNRIDLKNDPVYKKEVTELSEVQDPQELFFELSSEQSKFYDRVVSDYFGPEGQFTGAIYQPFLYEKREKIEKEKLGEEENRAFQQQRNLFDFMRRLLVKRFESSFGAFSKSIQNFIKIHEIILEFIENSGGQYILDRSLIEKIYQDDAEEIEEALFEFAQKLKEQKRPKHDRIYNVNNFDAKDEFLHDIKNDLNLLQKIESQIQRMHLVEKDPKAEKLLEALPEILNNKSGDHEPVRKVVIFSEYVDTVNHILPYLEKKFKGRILVVPGKITKTVARQILNNFDASVKEEEWEDQFDILLASDKISEGFNLNRAGAIVNYDIPWNPTRVIQRVGRINRIGRKVFEKLYIYNFFPTEIGSDIVKSRKIAEQKMFLIHNTLGEDAKIFHEDEEPQASELYKRINLNPEEGEEEDIYTQIRTRYLQMKEKYPEVIHKISQLPYRIKTAKKFDKDQLLVFQRKGLAFFVHGMVDLQNSNNIHPLTFHEALPLIEADPDEPRLKFSERFWENYKKIKEFQEDLPVRQHAQSLENKALNNLRSVVKFFGSQLGEDAFYVRALIKDLRDYRTIPFDLLRNLTSVEITSNDPELLEKFQNELRKVKKFIPVDFLEKLESRIGEIKSEVIVAVENRGDE
ncbi:MAG: helicase-related protein [Calditrichia bacterium]